MPKKWRLKPHMENFMIVDGPMAGRRFERGKTYCDIPNGETHRFEEVAEHPAIEAAAEAEPAPKKNKSKKTGLKNGATGASDPRRFESIAYDPGK